MGALTNRASGVLLPVISIPSKFGIGDLGPETLRFVDYLAESCQSYWQVLPLNPTSQACGNSPYTSNSGFAGNYLMISPELMVSDGLIEDAAPSGFGTQSNRIDYSAVAAFKSGLMNKAYNKFKEKYSDFRNEYEAFIVASSWINDYALFKALREASGMPWHSWAVEIRDRDARTISQKEWQLRDAIGLERFTQFVFFKQWQSLKCYCQKRGISIIGDLPFYIDHDSADVWANQQCFQLDDSKRPKYVSGVPPDYFSATGQLWGHPVYDWDALRSTDFGLWIRRIEHNLKLFDLLRIDHFRGLVAYWAVPSSEKSATNGRWVTVPSQEFFSSLRRSFPSMPFIAEDLGIITDDVRRALSSLNLPGMKVLIFAFDCDDNNLNLPKNHIGNSIVYTGTHDTNTVKGWFMNEANPDMRQCLFRHLGRAVSEEDVSWEFIKMAAASNSDLCIIPFQDMLSLGSDARLNNPAAALNNYLWKYPEPHIPQSPFVRLREVTASSNRSRKS